jgi:exopolysaccharide biosynthesis WecB/TagA/CpsF family protein
MREKKKVNIGGLPITKMTRFEMAQEFLRDYHCNPDEKRLPRFSTSANGHVLALAERDAEFRRVLLEADHIDADGMPLVIASRYLAHDRLPERIATTDFIHDVAKTMMESTARFYLLGATPANNAKAIDELRSAYPWLAISGHHGYFDSADEENILTSIRSFKPDLLWVGLGVPREHEFVVRNRNKLCGITWIKTCGGLFDFLAGERRRAPLWVQHIGLEWLWRMAQEPARLGPRYWSTNGEALRLMWRYRSQ